MADDSKTLEEIASSLSGIQKQLSEITELLQKIVDSLEDTQLPPQARAY